MINPLRSLRSLLARARATVQRYALDEHADDARAMLTAKARGVEGPELERLFARWKKSRRVLIRSGGMAARIVANSPVPAKA